MTKKLHENMQTDPDDDLRRQAEAHLKQEKRSLPEGEFQADAQALLEELQIHQVELELQNEELRLAQERLITEREKYADLYNFAPVAYFLLDENDVILNLNFSAGQLLGKERSSLLNRPLTAYLSPDSLQKFQAHRQHVRYSGLPQSCELEIRTASRSTIFVHARTALLRDRRDEDRKQHLWRTVMTDVTETKRVNDALKRSRDLLLALSEGARAVHLGTTREEIYAAVGKQITHLGSDLLIFSFSAEEKQIRTEYKRFTRERYQVWEQHIDSFFGKAAFSVPDDGYTAKVLQEKRTVFVQDIEQAFAARMPDDETSPFFNLVQQLGIKQVIIAPLTVADDVIGLLMVSGDTLVETDVYAVDVFAEQTAISLHKAHLMGELEKALEGQRELAQSDPLTGIRNRRAFDVLAQKELDIAKRYQRPVSMLILDLDHFKSVNDRFGHNFGDEMLKHFVAVIRAELRAADIFARYGGDEFVILMPETRVDEAQKMAKRLRATIQNSPLKHAEGDVPLTVSIGVVGYETGVQEFREVIRNVDQALYAAKEAGRNQVMIYRH